MLLYDILNRLEALDALSGGLSGEFFSTGE